MKKGYFSMLSKIIKEKKANGQYVIERSSLEEYIDLSDEDEKEKDGILKGYMCAAALNGENYRSFARGYGIYVDAEALKSKALLEWLIKNVAEDRKAKAAIEHALARQLEELPDKNEDGAQLTFDIQDDEMVMFPELTKQEVIELIRKLNGTGL